MGEITINMEELANKLLDSGILDSNLDIIEGDHSDYSDIIFDYIHIWMKPNELLKNENDINEEMPIFLVDQAIIRLQKRKEQMLNDPENKKLLDNPKQTFFTEVEE